MEKKQRNVLIVAVVFAIVITSIGFIQFTGFYLVPNGGGGGDLPVFYDSLPSTPTLYDIQPDPDPDVSVNLDWSASTDVWYYNVYRRTGGSEQKITGIPTNSFTDATTKENRKYYYRIEAVNNVGKVQSNEESVTINVQGDPLPPEPTKPDAPTLNTIIPSPSTDGEIRLEWNLVSDAVNYVVYRTKEGDDIEILDDSISNNYYDDSVSNGVYYYKIKAGNSEEEYSDFSNEVSIIVTIPDIPDIPEAYQITYETIDSGIEITVSWSEVNCISYNLYKEIVTETKNTGFVLIEEGLTSTSYSETLTEIGKYTYKISAVNDIGESEQSNLTVINITEEGVTDDSEVDDYTWLYIILIILCISVVPVVILTRKRKK